MASFVDIGFRKMNANAIKGTLGENTRDLVDVLGLFTILDDSLMMRVNFDQDILEIIDGSNYSNQKRNDLFVADKILCGSISVDNSSGSFMVSILDFQD